jgi:hypothetical protein
MPHTEVTINDVKKRWPLAGTSNHEAFYLGIIEILSREIHAHAASVSIVLGEQTAKRQLNGKDRREDEGMRVLYEAVKILETRIPGGVTYR